MSIDFKPESWEDIKRNYGLWWERKLERPILPVILEGREPGRKEPNTPLLSQSNCNDFTVSARDIIDRIDYELSKKIYLGDAFPFFNLDCFGPGVVAAFLGAKLDNSSGRVWFEPKEILPIEDLHFEYSSDNIWLNRIKEICFEGMKRWQGQVLLGMPDLGGVLDILATFRSSENLLMDLYDSPEEVKRTVWEINGLWHRYYNEINEVLRPVNPGYSDWSQIYSDKPSYVLQNDFSYMIGPHMFNEFARPELEASCKKLCHTIYHLDGVGELPHLDSLLQIDELDAVQWMPGAGKPGQEEWPEVLRKIKNSGKLIQLNGGPSCLESVSCLLGSSAGIHHPAITMPISEENNARVLLSKYMK